MKPLESDWKKYSALKSEWLERYLQAKNLEMIAILQRQEQSSTQNFWEVKKRIDEEAR